MAQPQLNLFSVLILDLTLYPTPTLALTLTRDLSHLVRGPALRAALGGIQMLAAELVVRHLCPHHKSQSVIVSCQRGKPMPSERRLNLCVRDACNVCLAGFCLDAQ